jgi:hypothetical protein
LMPPLGQNYPIVHMFHLKGLFMGSSFINI